MQAKRVEFKNKSGVTLAGRLELPLDKKPSNYAILAHCFTCGKDLKAVKTIAMAIKQQGIAVLRFDFTGLGQSEGEFANSHFSSNLDDLVAAYQFLEEKHEAPSLIIGHSLGGTAALMAASQMEAIEAVATIGSPCSPEHILNLLDDDLQEIEAQGQARVKLAGRQFTISQRFVEDVKNHKMEQAIADLRGRSLLVLHAPHDEIVGIENARQIYESAHHPKSFISLDGANHLLTQKEDAAYVGEVIASWAARYLPQKRKNALQSDEAVLAQLEEGPFLTRILAGKHHLLADEPKDIGGEDLGPTPYELVAAGLGACTSMTIKMYIDRKGWEVELINVHLSYDGNHREDCENCEEENRKMGRFVRKIELKGKLDKKQKQRILAIANKCPVHRTLEQGVKVHTELLHKND